MINGDKIMISETDKSIILQYAKKYNVSSIILFGSSLETNKKANDIDLGVKGIEPCLFFKFYAELFKHLSKPAHLIDLSKKSLFNDLVEETGVQIYGRSG
jgi:predicted nucleotidyltransferase